MATPAAPSASASARTVAVSWQAPASGPPPTGYVVRRYDAAGGAPIEVLGSCAGVQTGISCAESPVPPGSWRYTVTAQRGAWEGQESPLGPAVTVEAPALSLTPTTITSLPATLNGGISGFAPGQTLVARLDDPDSGTLLGGTINPIVVPPSGSATGTAVVPASVSNGQHTIYVVGSGGDVASLPITVVTPSVSAATIAKTAGGDPGFVRRSGTYYVYANVTGSGSPPAGLATVRANVSSLTSGQTSVAMTAGSYSVGGSSYNYRSAQLTAGSSLTEGSKSFSVTATDTGGTQRTANDSVMADNTAPTAAAVQTANGAGGTVGRAQLGDTLTLTWSEPIDAQSVLSGWDGSSTSVVVRLINGANDSVQIWNAANTTQLRLGTVSLGRNDYTSSTVTFGATGTPSTIVRSGNTVTVTLGTASGTVGTAAGTGTMTWTPVSTATDRAANAASTAARTESGGADADF